MLSTYSITPDLNTCLKCDAEQRPATDGPEGIHRRPAYVCRLCVDMLSEVAVLETASAHEEEQEVVDELTSPCTNVSLYLVITGGTSVLSWVNCAV